MGIEGKEGSGSFLKKGWPPANQKTLFCRDMGAGSANPHAPE